MAQLQRSSGLLLHPTSLPGPYGIGDLGKSAYQWIDFMVNAGQTIWQILPLGPTGYGNSPYQATSVFAGNPLLLDLEDLAARDLIPGEALEHHRAFPDHRVDFPAVIDWKLPLVLSTRERFHERADADTRSRYAAYCEENGARWLNDYALFMSIKNRQGGASWTDWPEPLRLRHPEAVAAAEADLADDIESHKVVQFLFFEQWSRLRAYANEKGVAIMGDIPIYVTYDSAEVWGNQDRFALDGEGKPTEVAGVPPDYFSETGQLWGNPLYRWDRMAENDFAWWVERIRVTTTFVDWVRIDHFRGFEAFWAVPFGEETAMNGTWKKAPGVALFETIRRELGDLPIVVEDLGFITREVRELRDRFGFPGMKILQFAFGGDPSEPFLPHNYDPNCIVYTGSHDNDTTLGWFNSAPENEREFCLRYLGGHQEDITQSLVRLAMGSTAILCIFPVQDVLSLGPDARMNRPGQPDGNWEWRLQPGQLESRHADRMADLAHMFNRVPGREDGE